MELALPIIILLILVFSEAFILRFLKKQNVNWKDIIFNLNSGHIVLWLFRGLEVICFNYLYTHFSLDLFSSFPIIVTWIFAIFAWDLGFYWLHRLHHKIPLFWAIHVVHHQGEHFNLSLAMRNSWYSSLSSIPFFALLAIIGVPTYIFVAVSILHYSVQFFNHNALTPKLGIIEKFIVTPAHHRLHHIKDKYYSNHNFGGTFIFWDKLFGSFESNYPEEKHIYGSYNKSSENPFHANNIPFLRFFNLKPKPISQAKSFDISNFYFALGGFLLFTLTICYIYTYGYGYENVNYQQYSLFAYLVLGTIALGGIAEGKLWGIYSWFILSILLPILFLHIWDWQNYYWQIVMYLLFIHGALALFAINRNNDEISKQLIN
jgi:sterol desaturase/sphingolipid hydroxylase (fatty acid hydroxylase superfamily)